MALKLVHHCHLWKHNGGTVSGFMDIMGQHYYNKIPFLHHGRSKIWKAHFFTSLQRKAYQTNVLVVLLHIFWVGRCTGDPIMARVGYRNPVPIWHRYLCYRYVLEPNQNADFGAMPEWSVEIFVLSFFKTDVRSIITVCNKLFPDWKMHARKLNSESSYNTSPTHFCSNASVLFSHSNLKAQLGKWEHLRSTLMQWIHLLWWQQIAFH